MTPEVLQGLLWRARNNLRADAINLSAGHGVADPNYLPPRLPYASVLGPLNIETESSRELPEYAFIRVRGPGFVTGVTRQETDLIPTSGSLHLRLDGDAVLHLALDFDALGTLPFNQANGPAAATVIQTALHDAVDAEAVELTEGLLDAARQAELRATTVRWDRHQARLVIASGRRGTIDDPEHALALPSRVEVIEGADNLADALGLGEGSEQSESRIIHHRVSNPMALDVDVRLDLWAGSQRELALMLDSWCRMTPTRGQLLVRPGLLREDVADGATSLQLQRAGESPQPATLLQLEAERTFVDRLSGEAPALQAGATLDAEGLHLNGSALATLLVYESPPVPYPWRPDNPGPYGFAAALGLRLEADPAEGDTAVVMQLVSDTRTVLQLSIVRPAPVNGEEAQIDLTVSAQQADGTAFAGSGARVALSRLRSQQGVQVHLLVSTQDGETRVFIDGTPGVAPSGFSPGVANPGVGSGGSDMMLRLGDSDGTAMQCNLSHVQLYGRPLGPSDPQLRNSINPASSWLPGEPITLAHSSDGYTTDGEPFAAIVAAVDGDTLYLDRPVQGDWPLAETLVYQRGLFFSQKQFRRRDDFMNQLYRVTVEYRVSAYLQEHRPAISVPLVEDYDVNIRVLDRLLAEQANPQSPDYPSRPATGGMGVRSSIQSAQGNRG